MASASVLPHQTPPATDDPNATSWISTHHTFLASPIPSSPSFHIHLTRMRDTLFLWIGTGKPTDGSIGGDQVISVEEILSEPDERRLAADWGVAMPSRGVMPVSGTSIYRSGANDLAVPMAKRLARRFPSNQVHVSLSLPASLTPQGGASLDPLASRTLLLLEKKLVEWVREILVQPVEEM